MGFRPIKMNDLHINHRCNIIKIILPQKLLKNLLRTFALLSFYQQSQQKVLLRIIKENKGSEKFYIIIFLLMSRKIAPTLVVNKVDKR